MLTSFIKHECALILKSKYYRASTMEPAVRSHFLKLEPLFKRFARGRLLDIGAGKMQYRPLVEPFISRYLGLDIIRSSPELNLQADAQALPFRTGTFDTILSTHVYEHVPEPWQGIEEASRILKKGGHLILCLPHLSFIHKEPHDYYRFTSYGIAHLLKRTALRPVIIEPSAGLFSFLGFIPTMLLLSLTHRIAGLNKLSFKLAEGWTELMLLLDKYTDKKKYYALNYIVVARKEA